MSSQMSAIELLNLGDRNRDTTFLTKYWAPFLGTFFGVVTGTAINVATRRPPFSGIQKHIIGVIGFTTVIQLIQNKRRDYLAEKDAVLRHYIELHPEDFQEPEKKKLADILEPWIPIR